MSKKNIIVTGGTDGIGLALVKKLLEKEHSVCAHLIELRVRSGRCAVEVRLPRDGVEDPCLVDGHARLGQLHADIEAFSKQLHRKTRFCFSAFAVKALTFPLLLLFLIRRRGPVVRDGCCRP